jgi:outer membrane murein-binding lipoprotein Lpp
MTAALRTKGRVDCATMTSPTYDSAFVDELIADVDAYLHRCDVLTDFAESQVEERVRLARLVNRLASDRDGLQLTIDQLEQQVDSLDTRLRALESSAAVRLTRVPRKLARMARRARTK